jgi:hypothetical protein
MLNVPGLGPKWNLHTSESELALDSLSGAGSVGDQRFELNCGERSLLLFIIKLNCGVLEVGGELR